jgi:hypothetical protein
MYSVASRCPKTLDLESPKASSKMGISVTHPDQASLSEGSYREPDLAVICPTNRTYGNLELGPLIHSARSNITGSTESARCAGIHVASRPISDIAKTTPASTSGSRGVA